MTIIVELCKTCETQCGPLKGKKQHEMTLAFFVGAWSGLCAVEHPDAAWVGRFTTLLIATRGFDEVKRVLAEETEQPPLPLPVGKKTPPSNDA